MNLSERIKTAIKSRSNFSLSYDSVLTGDWGDIIPICCKEMVPTDSFTVQGQVFMRLANLASPTFGRIHGFVNHFFVPYRILMPEYAFEDSMTGGTDGTAPEEFPFITYRMLARIFQQITTLWGESYAKRFLKLMSYLGLGFLANMINAYAELDSPEYDTVEHSVSLLPFLAVARVYGDYYFPYGLEEDAVVREALHRKYKGLISFASYAGEDMTYLSYAFMCSTACYTKDYFTSAFTRPQRGDASIVPVDLGTDVNGNLTYPASPGNSNIKTGRTSDGLKSVYSNASPSSPQSTYIGQFQAHAMRWAEKIQAFLERNNIAGGRYFEQMLARFGVKLKAEQLQRSQYLGGSDFWVNVSDVTRTSSTSDQNQVQVGLGSQAGKGVALGKDSVSYRADEYGLFLTLFHFVPETGYVDGLEKMWTRHSRFDYWQPELEDTGNQPILNKELNGYRTLLEFSAGDPDGVFGYVPRYSEYKFANPILGGEFAIGGGMYSDQLMNSYHLYRRFDVSDAPNLNVDFVRLVPLSTYGYEGYNNYNRIFQFSDSGQDHFFINVQMSIGANRPMIGFAESALEFANDEGSGSVNVPYGGVRL